jgi:hypothetical protein
MSQRFGHINIQCYGHLLYVEQKECLKSKEWRGSINDHWQTQSNAERSDECRQKSMKTMDRQRKREDWTKASSQGNTSS